MTENKRFKLKYINEQHISANLYDNKTFICAIGMGEELIVELLNDLSDENKQLKEINQELSNIISAIEKGSCRSIDSFLDTYCTDEILKEFDLE